MSICRWQPGYGHDIVGDACPECGHTNIVHPGPQNPALRECVICTVLPKKEDGGMKSEIQIRAKISEFTTRAADPKTSSTGRSILAIRIETLRWALGEEEESVG